MEREEIKEIVTETVNCLLQSGMFKYNDAVVYELISDKLRTYYAEDCKDAGITEALKQLEDHQYYEILGMYYGGGYTLEELAQEYYVDISTIVRNKKALCLKLFNLLN